MADDDILDFTVQLLSGERLNVQVPKDLRVSDLKILVEEQLNIPPENQRIIFQGQHLDSNRTLNDYNIRSGHRVHLVHLHRAEQSSDISFPSSDTRSNNIPLSRCSATMTHPRRSSIDTTESNNNNNRERSTNNVSDNNNTGAVAAAAAPPAITNDIFNSLIHSMAHSAATSVASVVASNAVAQLGFTPGIIPNTSFSFSLPNMSGATINNISTINMSSGVLSSSASTINNHNSGRFPPPPPPPLPTGAGFPPAGFQGAQRFGPFVMGEYNGIPVAIGGALVGGTPMSPRVYVGGFSSPASNNITSSSISTSDITSSSQSITIDAVSSNNTTTTTSTIAGTISNQTEGSSSSSEPVTTFSEGVSTTNQRPRNPDNRIGTLISNIIQHLTPTVTSMTANAVSRYIPSIETQNLVTSPLDTTTTIINTPAPAATEQRRVEHIPSNQIHSETMRRGLNGFINSISDVLSSASENIRDANERTSQLGNQLDASSQRGALNTGLGGAGGNGSQRLYISNDYVNDRLPWEALDQLLDLLQEETGWRRPRMQIPPTPNPLGGGPGPISIFLSAYGQVTNIIQTLFLQIQAWQEGFAALDVPRFGRTVQALALTSQINAQISSLLAWIFQSMVEHVDPENLNTAMGWHSHVVENENTPAGGENRSTRNVTSVALESKINEELNEEKTEVANINANDLSDEEMKSAHESFVSEETSENAVRMQHSSNDTQQSSTLNNERTDHETPEMPQEVMRRFTDWTSDPVHFSKQVLRDARQVPFSSSYISGDATASSNLRNATQEAADRIFSLNWHRALNRMNITDEYEAPQELNEMYMSQTMTELVENVRNNSDYQQQSNQYPGIQRALQCIDELRTVGISDNRENESESDDAVMVEFENDLKTK